MVDPDLSRAKDHLRAGRATEAVALLGAATARAATVGPAHNLLLDTLLRLGRRNDAAAVHDAALSLDRTSADASDALAFFARQLGRHELSNSLYREATQKAPQDAQIWYNLATSERTMGRLTAAADACDQALRLAPDFRPAILLRSEVSKASAGSNHVAELRRRIGAAAESPDAMFLFYALGKELHELGEFDEAFEAFSRGAAVRRRSLSYDVSQDEAKLKRITEVYRTGAPARADAPVGRHIFILGLPRSGTTLTERIVGGLSGVTSNDETDNFSTALLSATTYGAEDVFARAAKADHARVAAAYDALAVRGDSGGKIIEKLPFNYLYIGSILRAFPDAAVLWVRRNPVDVCFAMYRTLFAAAYPFSYDFDELARYYAAYWRLMQHWRNIYPDQLTPIDYEALVSAPDINAERIARCCGLTWETAALDIAQNRSASLTASAAQVRGGIYASSSGLWRQYERHLSPLVAALTAQGIDVSAA